MPQRGYGPTHLLIHFIIIIIIIIIITKVYTLEWHCCMKLLQNHCTKI